MDDDKDKAVATRQRMPRPARRRPDIRGKLPHAVPRLGWIDKTAVGFRWVPHSYQLNL